MGIKKGVCDVKKHHMGDTVPDGLKLLMPRMHDIYNSLFHAADDFDWINAFLRRGDNTTLGLFYGQCGELAGFSSTSIDTLSIGTKTYAVYSAGIYSDLDYDVGPAFARFGLQMALKYKLRHPTHRLAFLAETSSPAPYCLYLNTLSECYPHPNLKTPNYVYSLIDALKSRRKFIQVEQSPFVVTYPFRRSIKNPGKIRQSKKLHDSPYFKHYLKLNPRFESDHSLLVFTPLSLKNIVSGLMTGLKARCRRLFK